MKRILLITFLVLNLKCHSQNLVGIWQADTSSIASGYLDTYQFFSDGTFKFNPSQNNGLRRILSIGGTYKLVGSKLIFTINYTIEIIGGAINRSETNTESDSWTIDNGQIKKILQAEPAIQSAEIEFEKGDKVLKSILIDKRKYFKIDNDPNNYD